MHQIRKISVSAALFATVSCVAAPGFAQSLALTYKLDARPDTTQQAPAVMNRCAGFNWMTSIGACGRELLTRITPARGESVYSAGMVFESAEVGTVSELPSLGAPVAQPRIRAASGTETLLGSTRSADLLLRVGSKHRPKGNDDGLNAHRFTDANYETHVQNKGFKAVGVELLVPFQ